MELPKIIGTIYEKHSVWGITAKKKKKLASPSACSILFILTLDFHFCIKETTNHFLEPSCKLMGEHSDTVLIFSGTICNSLEIRAHDERLVVGRRVPLGDTGDILSLSATSTLSILFTCQRGTGCGICPLIYTHRSLF